MEFDSDAVIDFEDVKSRGDRKAVFNVVQKLKDLGPDLPSPHMKSLKGEANLFELRPKQGACEARPIYARFGGREEERLRSSRRGCERSPEPPRLTADNRAIIMTTMAASQKNFDALLAEEQLADPSFRAEWQRLAPGREFAATLLRYRAEHKLSQRALAKKLGVSQPRVVKLESGEHNPEVDTIINAVRRLGIEFVLDVAPASRKPTLVTARAQKRGAIAHDDVSVVAASSV